MTSISTSFSAVGTSSSTLTVFAGRTATWSVTGTFVATVLLERTTNGGQTWSEVTSTSAAATGTLLEPGTYRWRCTARTSGTAVAGIADVSDVIPGGLTNPMENEAGQTVLAVTEAGVESINGDFDAAQAGAMTITGSLALPNGIVVLSGEGAPVNGTTGEDVAGTGSTYTDIETGDVYVNTGDAEDTVWEQLGGGGGGSEPDPLNQVVIFDDFLYPHLNMIAADGGGSQGNFASPFFVNGGKFKSDSPGNYEPGIALGKRVGVCWYSQTCDDQGTLLFAYAIKLGNGAIVYEMDLNIGTLSDGTNEYDLLIGLIDGLDLPSSDPANRLSIVYDRNASVNYRAISEANDVSTGTVTTSSVAVATGWTRYRFEINAAATQVVYKVDVGCTGTYTTIATHTANIDTTTTTMYPSIAMVGSNGSAERFFYIDWHKLVLSYTTPR